MNVSSENILQSGHRILQNGVLSVESVLYCTTFFWYHNCLQLYDEREPCTEEEQYYVSMKMCYFPGPNQSQRALGGTAQYSRSRCKPSIPSLCAIYKARLILCGLRLSPAGRVDKYFPLYISYWYYRTYMKCWTIAFWLPLLLACLTIIFRISIKSSLCFQLQALQSGKIQRKDSLAMSYIRSHKLEQKHPCP